ncbi:zinc-binding dehydrogenase [Rathayibacter sp. Leaf296]|uniref:zinc-binding dehydrogenase n=1 Tax=Rathayibacter sp. Leaf296 TaxID=1736327 RepID=UPI000703374F|nr:zinc-binding dehydrogenase [Rathayibacter sp. Leaf296]KQQ08740.1 L-idonate 5-dehydrogenase [Rathayibacter sp. Leaf296]
MKTTSISGKLDLAVAEVPLPKPGPGEIRIRVSFVGICGSDLHYYFEGANGAFVVKEPLTPGHELSGHVDLDPSGRLTPGTPVTIHPARFGATDDSIPDAPHLWSGGSYLGSASTTPHTQGAMAEYLLVDASMVRILPQGLPVLRAVLAEPLAVGLHAVARAGSVHGARVLISGAGPIGLLTAAAASAAGASSVVVSDVLAEPLALALTIGAHETRHVGVDTIEADSFDVVFECSGAAAAISSAVIAVRRRGTVVQVGMVPAEARPVALAPLISKEVTLIGVFRFLDEIDEALLLLAQRPEIEAVVTHVLPVEDVQQAFELAKASSVSSKVVVDLSDDRHQVDARIVAA